MEKYVNKIPLFCLNIGSDIQVEEFLDIFPQIFVSCL